MKVISFLARIGKNVRAINIWLSLYNSLFWGICESFRLRFNIFALLCVSLLCLRIYLRARAIFLRARVLGLYLNCDSYLRSLKSWAQFVFQ